MRGPGCSLGVAALAVALVAAPPADAALLSRGGSDIFYFGEAGEVNDVAVELFSAPPDFHIFSDPGNTIDATSGCFNLTPDLAACQAQAGDTITVVLADGDDRLLSLSPFPVFGCGGEGGDELLGGDGEDFLLGESGSDTIDAGAGNDIVITNTNVCDPGMSPPAPDEAEGGDGEDALIGGKGADTLSGGAGSDTLFGARVNEGVAGDAGDELTGGDGDDQLVGHDGEDRLDGGTGADMLAGGDGDDRLLGGDEDDQLGVTVNQSFGQGETLQRVLTSENGADLLDGGAGDDLLNAGPGRDVLNFGLEGSIDASETTSPNGPDDVAGGAGHDTVSYVNLALRVEVTPDGAANDGSAGEGDNVRPDNEVLVGGSAGDILVGRDSSETIDGGKGGDRIDGAGGDDTLRGGAEDGGADVVLGGTGADSLAGGPGDDSLEGQDGMDAVDGGGGADIAGGGADPDRVSGGAGLDSLSGGPGDDRLRGGAEALVGADGADVLRGEEGKDDLDGGAGDDTLAGGSGGDAIAGAEGRDLADYQTAAGPVTVDLDGAPGDGEAGEGDHVHADVEGARGGPGRDTLAGNPEANMLEGGDGEDYIDGEGGADTLDGGGGRDAVRARDRSADSLECGGSLDFAIVNRLDRVGDDCERIDEGGRRRPALGRSMVVRPTGGSVELRVAGTRRFIPLLDPLTLPFGSTVDAADGAVRLVTARSERGLQSGRFDGGAFRVRQRRSGFTGLRLLGGDFGGCAGSEETVRALSGRGRGRFRTWGLHSVTTTAGRSSWVVEDRCDGSLTRAGRGGAVVLHLELETTRTVVLAPGEEYLARDL
jgi:Ca2+-binding RTX toxin-like protein